MLKFSLAAAAVLLALTALAVAQDDCTTCIGDPTDPSCASCDYALGNATADIENLCQVMPGMSMCSLKIICESGSGGVSEEYCTPMSLLASTCSIDTGMGSMSGCANYNVLCKGTSAVRSPSCDALAMPMLPTTISVVNAVKDICTDHFMADCDRCDSTFTRCDDPLLTLSMMCNVHEMGPCTEFYAFCEENGQAATGLCQTLDAHGDRIPTMRMYFHTGLEDFVLFYSWVPRTVGGYVVTFFGIMAIGIFSAFLKASKVMVEEKWRRRRAKARRAKQASKITWTRSSPTVMKWERDPRPASSASAGLPDASALSGEAIVDDAAPLGISRSPHTSYSSSTDEQEEWLSSETDAGAGVVQRRTRAAEEGSPAGLGGPDGPAAPMALAPPTSWKPDDWTENVLRFGFQLMIVTIDYGLMLISMTFNAGLFIATVLGIALGHLFFGHVIAKGPEVADCCG